MVKQEKTFEQKMSDIEKIIDSLDKKEIQLEQSLELFEKGIGLIRECQKALQTAEQNISILNNENIPDEENDQTR